MNGIYIADWREHIHFSSDGPQPQPLLVREPIKVVTAGLQAGQSIPPHPEGLAIYYFLEGTGWMTLDDEKLRIHPGVIVITEEGAVRGMQAETQLSFMAVRATSLDQN